MILETTEAYLELIASGLTATTGVKIVSGEEWVANVGKKTLTYDTESLKSLPFTAVKGVLLHEIGHLKYTGVTPISPLQKKYPHLQDVYNAFEDLRIELALENEYGDFARDVLSYAETLFSARHIGKDITRLPRYHQFMFLCLLKGLLQRRIAEPYWAPLREFMEWNEYGYSGGEKYLIGIDSKVKKRFFDGKNLPIVREIIQACEEAKSISELKEIVDTKLYPIIEDFIKEHQPPPQLTAVVPVRLAGGATGAGKKGEKIDLKTFSEEETKALIRPYVNVLVNRLKDVLKEKATIRWQGSHYRGKLLSKNVFKICVDEDRVFSKRTNPDTPHYKVHFVLDASGSMVVDDWGNKVSKAINSFIGACLLDEVSRELGFERSAYAFDINPYQLKKLDQYRTMVGGGTDDIPMLKMLLKDLKKENDNLVFIFTDGYSPDRNNEISTLIKEIEAKNATLVGICFGTENQNRCLIQRYPQHLLLGKPEDLLLSLIDKLRQMIQR